jgi:hypothetical protein
MVCGVLLVDDEGRKTLKVNLPPIPADTKLAICFHDKLPNSIIATGLYPPTKGRIWKLRVSKYVRKRTKGG